MSMEPPHNVCASIYFASKCVRICQAPVARGKATEAPKGKLLESHLRFCTARSAQALPPAVGRGDCVTEVAGGSTNVDDSVAQRRKL